MRRQDSQLKRWNEILNALGKDESMQYDYKQAGDVNAPQMGGSAEGFMGPEQTVGGGEYSGEFTGSTEAPPDTTGGASMWDYAAATVAKTIPSIIQASTQRRQQAPAAVMGGGKPAFQMPNLFAGRTSPPDRRKALLARYLMGR